jgi:hypothetical protein
MYPCGPQGLALSGFLDWSESRIFGKNLPSSAKATWILQDSTLRLRARLQEIPAFSRPDIHYKLFRESAAILRPSGQSQLPWNVNCSREDAEA